MQIEWLNVVPEVTHPGMWDDTWLRELLDGVHGPVPDVGTVVVVPGRYHHERGLFRTIQRRINKHDSALVIVTADEANEFPTDLLEHDNMVVWVQTLNPARFEQGFQAFPLGYPPDTRQMISGFGDPGGVLDADWWFAGQITHQRRKDAVAALSGIANGDLVETEGFTQGWPRDEYLEQMTLTKVAPCPSGPETQDTFRLWEALAAGAIPIADASTPTRHDDGFWLRLFGESPPFPIIEDWATVGPVIGELVEGWPHTANKVQAWYTRYRRGWAQRLTDTLAELTPYDPNVAVDLDGMVTVLIPTSPVPCHPDTSIIEETVASVRERFPKSDIRIMVDGVRPEQWARTPDYHEYTRRLLWLAHNVWWNVTVTVHDVHKHQATMAREELESVATPLLLYVEHDTPLINDWPVTELVQPLLTFDAHLIRLNHEHMIHPEHAHLLADDGPTVMNGLPYRKTIQWSQRPHLARVDMYRLWLDDWFTPGERSMIEDKMHSVVQRYPWGRFKIWLYTPEGNMQRSIHTDARGDQVKYGNVR